MFGSLLKLAVDVVSLPIDAAVDVAKRVVVPNTDDESRVARRLELIDEDLELED